MRLEVLVKPRARREGVRVLGEGSYEVSVAALPERGKANRRVLRLLADHLRLPMGRLRMIRGGAGPRKAVEVLDS